MLRTVTRTARLRAPTRAAGDAQLDHAFSTFLRSRPCLGRNWPDRSLRPAYSRGFHSTPRNQGAPLVPVLIAALKSSAALETARTAGRLAMTFIPVLWITTKKSKWKLNRADSKGIEMPESRRISLLKQIQSHTFILRLLVSLPSILFVATIIASLERTPLTGRWRMILLSPEEEEEVAVQLAGQGWYRAVGEILEKDGHTKIVHPNDWRYQWVRENLRHLEQAIPVLLREKELCTDWYEHSDPGEKILPPPAGYPLRPRPRASEYLRAMAEKMCERSAPPVPHNIPGPPYSLLLVEKPEASNAFSYGFGPDGAGGIVVYTGFLDDVMSRIPCRAEASSWSSLFRSPSQPTPSPEQSSELAILLAHELSHLVLSHHLESLSSAKVIAPGIVSIVTDILRVVAFPITMLFGPFVNDSLSQLAKVGGAEFQKLDEYCTSMKQEIEADIVSARLLAHAGYDARDAVRFWEHRMASNCDDKDGEHQSHMRDMVDMAPRWMQGAARSHPINEVRVDFLKGELVRWETERRAAVRRQAEQPQPSSINLTTA